MRLRGGLNAAGALSACAAVRLKLVQRSRSGLLL
jgi:hypothetical protein